MLLLTETEEKGVHAHCVHTEESMGDEVGANYHSLVINKSDFIQKQQHDNSKLSREIKSSKETRLCFGLDKRERGNRLTRIGTQ